MKKSLVWVMILLIPLTFLLPAKKLAEAETPIDNIDVILIVDSSGSMKDNDPDAIRISAAKLFVDLAGDGDRIAIVNLSDKDQTKIITELTEISRWLDITIFGRRAIKESLDALAEPTGKATLMGTSLKLAYDILDRAEPGRRQFVVLITDGRPEGESETVLAEAIEAFEKKRFWKIFPIALGKGADFDFLEAELAGRTGGKAFKISTAAELLKTYTEIFASLHYNYYVNWVTIQPNVLQTLATITSEQRINSFAIVIPKEGDKPLIDVILSPAGVNIVDPAYAAGVYHAEDPMYEVYVTEAENVPLIGEWKIRLINEEPIEIAILVRSYLSIQLLSPSPQASWDELSPRYHPQGEAFFVQVGVRNAYVPLEMIFEPRAPIGTLELHLEPMIRMSSHLWDPITLRDDGLEVDIEKEDGLYTALYRRADVPGNYTLDIEIPSHKEEPFRLMKSRAIRVEPLPMLFLQLPPFEKLMEEVPIALGFQQPMGDPIPIISVEISLIVKEPGGDVYSIEAVPSGNQYIASFTVEGMGEYIISAVAIVRVKYNGKDISYTSFAQGTYEVPIPSIIVKPKETELGEMKVFKETQVTVELTSESFVTETVAVQIEGLPGGSVTPSSILVPPGDTAVFNFNISSSEILREVGQRQFKLVFTSPEGTAEIKNSEIIYTYTLLHTLEVYVERTDLGQVRNLKTIPVTVRIKSTSPMEQVVEARVEGLEGGKVFPQTIKVPPREETLFTFIVSASGPSETSPGMFKLILESPESAVTLINGNITFHYSLPSPIGRLVCLLVPIGLVILAVAFVVIRKL